MAILNRLKTTIRLLPTDLKCLFWFSACLFVSCTLLMVFAPKAIFEQIIPYTGWSPGLIYFPLVITLMAASKTRLKNEGDYENFFRVRYKIILIFGIALIFGIYDWSESAPEWYHSTNPYLRYDPLQPVYSIFLPLLWILIVGWPLIRNFMKKKLRVSV